MSLTIGNGGGGAGILSGNTTKNPYTHLPIRRHVLFPLSTRTTTLQVVSAKRFSSRTGRLDSKDRRGTATTKDEKQLQRTAEDKSSIENVGSVAADGAAAADGGYFLPELPGTEPDFWEGPDMEALGFFVQYMWAFGIVFAVFSLGFVHLGLRG
jgi:hypothetical protein